MKACVLGLGEIGLPTALYIKKKRFETWGYDIKEAAVVRAKKNGISATTNWDEIPPADIYVVTVSTLLKGGFADLTPVFNVCEKIANKRKPASLISIESTVIPGTCRKIYEKIFKKKAYLIHIPHRYWAGDPENYGVKQLRVIGGINVESLEKGQDIFEKQLKIPLFAVSPIEIAEMSKITENAYRYVQIAFAEELKQMCHELGLSFEDVRKACNTKWNIEILEAREGIGGHCLPKDIRYLASLTPHNVLLRSAIIVDHKYRQWLKKKIK